MAKEKEKKKGIAKFIAALKKSPLNYLSDLMIVSMVVLWIFDSVWETLVASTVTLSSIILSFKAGENCYNTDMWSSIGQNIAMPLTAGGLTWMLKNAGQHWIANKKGERAHEDFPNDRESGDNGDSEENGDDEGGDMEFVNLDESEEAG